MNKQWELYIDRKDFENFSNLMSEHGFGGFTASYQQNGFVWVICYPSEEIKMLSLLKFNIKEIVDKFGIDVDFTDCP